MGLRAVGQKRGRAAVAVRMRVGAARSCSNAVLCRPSPCRLALRMLMAETGSRCV